MSLESRIIQKDQIKAKTEMSKDIVINEQMAHLNLIS